jgi:hypothetical protein
MTGAIQDGLLNHKKKTFGCNSRGESYLKLRPSEQRSMEMEGYEKRINKF